LDSGCFISFVFNLSVKEWIMVNNKIKNKINNFIIIILTILAVLLSMFVIYMLILKLTGHSPDMVTIVMWTVGVLLTLQILILAILFPMKGSIGRLEEFKDHTINKINDINKRLKDKDI